MGTDNLVEGAGDFIFRHGRLLERQLYAHFFQSGTVGACLRALLAYQNPDGGFGNGIEPDLLCPDSSAIGAETALYYLDLIDAYDTEIVSRLVEWIAANQNDEGFIVHPTPGMLSYPHQQWWKNPDDARILALAGILKKRGVDAPDLYGKARRYYTNAAFPAKWDFYSYPYFVYLTYCGRGSQDQERLEGAVDALPGLLREQGDHFPLFGRYWFYAASTCAEDVLRREAKAFLDAFQEDGAIETPYPDLPWWRPIFTLDGLILLKKRSLI